jgi:succinoglycan biosynthesis transport protein ExoP
MSTPEARMSTPEAGPTELREYLTVLWRRKYLIAAMILVTLGAAIFYTQRQTPLYQSSAQVLVAPISLPLQGQQSYASVNMASEQLVAASPEVAKLAQRELASDGITPGVVSVESSLEDQTLIFAATSPRPPAARQTADAYASAYLDNRSLQLQQDLQDGEDSINAVIDDINEQIRRAESELAAAQASGDESRATVLQLRITSLSEQLTTQQTSLNQILLAGSAPVGHVVAPAYLPSSPSSPDVQRNRLLGVLLGISLGVGLAFLLERLDQRVRLREDVETSTGAPLIAKIPSATMPKAGLVILDEPYAVASEAYRLLRARVLFSTSQIGSGTIMVTSFQGREGKTTTAANLAAALAQAGKLTVLVSADLRRPSLVEFFGVERPGLTDVLSNEVDLLTALGPTEVQNLSVLGPGKHVDNPSELLGSEAMLGVMTRLADHADFVIVDAPPITGASDALTMASHLRHVLLVADARFAKRGTIKEAVLELRSVGAEVLGVVLTHVSPRDYPSYSYSAYSDGSKGRENGKKQVARQTGNLPSRRDRRS